MIDTRPDYPPEFDDDDRCPATVAIGYGGWFYWPTEYPEEGSVGPFETLEFCIGHLLEFDHVVEVIVEPDSDTARAEKAKVEAKGMQPNATIRN